MSELGAAKAAFNRVPTSSDFTFIVGPEAQEFILPRDLVAKLSRPLHALLNSGMRESLEGRVVWEHVSVRVFMHFMSYAHKGRCILDTKPNLASNGTDEFYDTISNMLHFMSIDDLVQRCSAAGRYQYNSVLGVMFENTQTSLLRTLAETNPDTCHLLESKCPSADAEDQIFVFAEIYMFADMYCIDGLALQAQIRLTAALKAHRLKPPGCERMVSVTLQVLETSASSEYLLHVFHRYWVFHLRRPDIVAALQLAGVDILELLEPRRRQVLEARIRMSGGM
ncbi:uncharacterized protein F5Z01DRAFT_637469 [Emericellopsis atlantica]|uniref:BTB domain-containing protein n=1 Tax=Emericellopsis atlantica TaxID=2614577 RepID=A0A9P7ZJL3_9HYPO|nr:uncharacterized protein F5Z01DRAFT_637469 [Emericellopsis atlantica]KAG9253210.1 hypothetical protein F5Z01DRAFT_637469 [Emericellopsis atlantica]